MGKEIFTLIEEEFKKIEERYNSLTDEKLIEAKDELLKIIDSLKSMERLIKERLLEMDIVILSRKERK
ncbi:MAG: hypothetical protein M0P49_02085 [Bacilli bacterium]|nr:hypothetical protein [Bacilli bacterium]